MSLNKNVRCPLKKKIAAVKDYLKARQPLREIARRHEISHSTLWHWIKRYQSRGRQGLVESKIQSRRLPREIETNVMRLKERHPEMTVRKARKMMKQAGIGISIYGIWRIWKDYGLIKNKRDDPLDVFIPLTSNLDRTINTARLYIEKEDYKQAAHILNCLPSMPKTQVLSRIPDRYLSPRRKLDRLCLERREGSYELFAARARRTSLMLERKGYLYSSIRADFYELDALDIIGQPDKKEEVLKKLSEKMRNIRNYPLRFLLWFEQTYTAVYQLKINRAIEYIEKCRRCVYLLPHPYYWELFGALLVLIGKFKNARGFYQKAVAKTSNHQISGRLILQMARYAHCYAGDYRKCRGMLARLKKENPDLTQGSAYNLTNAYLNFGNGDLTDAARHFVKSLETASRGKHTNRIYAASVGLAGISRALNQKKEARIYLRKYLPLIKKTRLLREELLLECFIDPHTVIPSEMRRISPFNLLNRLQQAHRTGKVGDYRKAFHFAEARGLAGLFHRWIVFFPESVTRLLEKGKKTGLPKTVLNFPVFNQRIPVYHLKLLGELRVTKNEKYLKPRLSPKEKSLLIHLALRAEAPGKFIALTLLGQNFWPKSLHMSILLSHLLVKIKAKLRMASHLLTVSSRGGEPKLINNGIYFTTDYAEFISLLTQARTLELSGEWHFSRREYLRAFALCRGEPFKKMYDGWSEDKRRGIINHLETETGRFARICMERGNKKIAAKLLNKIAGIIPGSPGINELQRLLK